MNDSSVRSEAYAPDSSGDMAQKAHSIAEGLGLPALIARILVARGIENPEQAQVFLKPRLENLSDPFLLPDMKKGVDRLIKAIHLGEKICLYGDYDADGVTSLVLMVNFLRHIGVEPVTYIPSRQEGYGLHKEAIENLTDKGIDLLLSLDCGCANVEEVRFAGERGIETIVLDHHEMGPVEPAAYALINPKRRDSSFPTRDLAACGVVFFFLLALRRTMHARGLLKKMINLKKELDIVTIGTIGDMVPLTGDNRIMVKHGLEMMNKHPKAWLKSMLKSGAISKGIVDEFALGFIIVPRINATGRVAKPETSLGFLTCDDEPAAASFLDDLHNANKHRQRVEEKILREIIAGLKEEGMDEKNSIVVYNDDWHIGVLGIVAQKLVEMFKKPAIVMTRVNGIWKGSGRGTPGTDLLKLVTSLSPLLLKYGGHKYACGISVDEKNIRAFADAFENMVDSEAVPERKKEVVCDTGAEFEELTIELMGYMEQLSPFGMGNPRPIIAFRPMDIAPLKYGRVKITDRNSRIWHGYLPVDQTIPQTKNLYLAASPVLRAEMGQSFINLNIKNIAEI